MKVKLEVGTYADVKDFEVLVIRVGKYDFAYSVVVFYKDEFDRVRVSPAFCYTSVSDAMEVRDCLHKSLDDDFYNDKFINLDVGMIDKKFTYGVLPDEER